MTRKRTLVVGAGSAGCVLAARLSEDVHRQVLLLEAGPDWSHVNRPANLSALNWQRARLEKRAWWSGLRVHDGPKTPGHDYARGRGIGGSAQVNGMLSLPGLPSDYDRWARDFGCVGWSWQDVQPTFQALRRHLRPATPEHLAPLDHAVLKAVEELGMASDIDTFGASLGAGRVWLSARDQRRFSSAEAWLDSARARPNLAIRADTTIRRILMASNRATGVEIATGEQIPADEVILAAGALMSPALLLRSGIERQGVGANLRDHPSIVVPTQANDRLLPPGADRPPINVLVRVSSGVAAGDVHVLPMTPERGAGEPALLLGLMTARSTGRVELDPRTPEIPRVRLEPLEAALDVEALRGALRRMRELMATGPLRPLFPDGHAVLPPQGEPDLRRWLRAQPPHIVHAAGTCRMGARDDPDAVVDTSCAVIGYDNLRVVDASVFPDLPAAGPHLPTVMVAERIASHLLHS